MKKECAEFLNTFIHDAMNCYNLYSRNNVDLFEIPETEKNKYHESVFRFTFQKFIEELKENIRTYEDILIVQDYVEVCFRGIDDVTPFHENENKWTIERGFEVTFLLNLKKSIEKYSNEIMACYSTSATVWYGTTLRYYFDKEIANLHKIDANEVSVSESIIIESKNEDRFDFDCFQLEVAKLSSNHEKIDLIKQRLIDFEQWQIKNNLMDNDSFWGSVNPGRAEFAKLCRSEMKRYPVGKDENIRIEPTQKQTEQKPYKWAMTDTDFLELFTALYQNECIKRKDGKNFTRKELTDYFQELFGLEIKDVEGKLTRATGRKMNMTPFLDRLKLAFEKYTEEKEKKQLKRK